MPEGKQGFQKEHGRIRTEESYAKAGKKISFALIGKPLSKEHKLKLRLAKLGKKQSPETIAKRILRGNKHYNWKGGKRNFYSASARAIYFENNTNVLCSKCGTHEDINIHHEDLDWKNNTLSNLLPICRRCHTRLHEEIKKLRISKKPLNLYR